jgi:hypothetical protein
VFRARYAVSPYIKQIRFVFKGLISNFTKHSYGTGYLVSPTVDTVSLNIPWLTKTEFHSSAWPSLYTHLIPMVRWAFRTVWYSKNVLDETVSRAGDMPNASNSVYCDRNVTMCNAKCHIFASEPCQRLGVLQWKSISEYTARVRLI